MDKNSLLWEKYKHDVELHRSYLDLVIKLNIFYYAITGAIISFYFLHIKDEPLVKYALVFPILMSLFLAVFFLSSAYASRPSQFEMERLGKALDFEVVSVVATVLEFLLIIFFILFMFVALGLIVLFFKDLNFCEYINNVW